MPSSVLIPFMWLHGLWGFDELRKKAWRDAYSSYKDKAKETKRKKGKTKKSDTASKKLNEAKAELKSFFWRATHIRIQVFKELAYKIWRHEKHIINTIETHYQYNRDSLSIQ